MMRWLLFIGSCLSIATATPRSNVDLDSLLRLLPLAPEDTNKVHLLHSIADLYEAAEPDKAKIFILRAGELSDRLGYKAGRLRFMKHMGYIYAYQFRHDSMLYYYKQALDVANELEDTYNIGLCTFIVGQAYQYLADYDQGLEYSFRGLKLLEGKGYTQIESTLYGGIMALYLMLKQYDKAIEYGELSVQLGRELEDKQPLAGSLANLANAYSELRDYGKARELYEESISIAQRLGNVTIEAAGWQGLAYLAFVTFDYAGVKRNTEKALVLQTRVQDFYGIMASEQMLANYYLRNGRFELARQHAEKALAINRQEDYKDARSKMLGTMAAVALATHDFDSAFHYAREADRVTEQLFTETIAEKDANMRVKYDTEKKETQIKLQQATIIQKNTLNYLLIGGGVALLAILFLGYRSHRHKQRMQEARIGELETEKQLAAAEAVLQGEEKERTRLAKDLHDGLGGMLSGVKHTFQNMKGNLILTPENAQAFERSIDMLDSSIKEMRRVAHNMMPESLVKFGLDAALRDYCKDIEDSGTLQVNYQSIGLETGVMEQSTAIAIFRMVQELLNNVQKHASATSALVQVSRADGTIAITVEDDGKGMDDPVVTQSGGMGWANIRGRVEYLRGHWDVQSSPGQGTSVWIEFKLLP